MAASLTVSIACCIALCVSCLRQYGCIAHCVICLCSCDCIVQCGICSCYMAGTHFWLWHIAAVQEIKGTKNLNISWKVLTEIMCRKLPDYAKFVLVTGTVGGRKGTHTHSHSHTYTHAGCGPCCAEQLFP
eukprot:scaffold294153_cov18-Tisochrysis_lutea.AAC.1